MCICACDSHVHALVASCLSRSIVTCIMFIIALYVCVLIYSKCHFGWLLPVSLSGYTAEMERLVRSSGEIKHACMYKQSVWVCT